MLMFTQEAQLPLRKQGVSLMHSFHHNATLGHLDFRVQLYVTCGIFSKVTWQRMRALLQESNSQLFGVTSLNNPRIYPHKKYTNTN